MTVTSRFASIADMQQIIAIGQDEGIALAVRQIDAVLAAPTKPQSARRAEAAASPAGKRLRIGSPTELLE